MKLYFTIQKHKKETYLNLKSILSLNIIHKINTNGVK